MPSAGPPSEQGEIAWGTWGERKQAPTSVPPEMLITGQRPPPTTSKYHRHGTSFQGSPVDPRTRSDERSWAATGSSPCAISARTSVGETPSTFTPWRATSDHSRSGPGWSGAPS